ncbi:MAG: GNAT family N-acetyltransferase [Arenimonas sp.]|nr:GNAT family N-acetyltransferase [Arenimonas sp.]MBP6625863.1 GNAT family N-acetyltransferase [Arenimonas sp.]
MDTVQVQRATGHELAELVPLFAGYLRFYHRPADEARIAAFLGDRLRGAQSVVFMAYLAERAIGFVQLYPAFASLAMAPSWILNDLYVAPQARGIGAGRALLEAARGLASDTGAAELFLQTARDNLGAQRLYESQGFQRDDVFLTYSLDPRAA